MLVCTLRNLGKPGFLLFYVLLPALLHAQSAPGLIDLFPELVEHTPHSALFTFRVNGSLHSSREFVAGPAGEFTHARLGLRAEVEEISGTADYHSRLIRFRNLSSDTLEIADLLPLGTSADRPFIIPYGPPGLARSTLFMPGKGPVGLIVPDNAWELGFTCLETSPESGMALLARRDSWELAERRRY